MARPTGVTTSCEKAEQTKRDREDELKELAIDLASKFLRRKNCVILDRRWRCEAGEVDIVAKRDDDLLFVDTLIKEADGGGFLEGPADAQTRELREKVAIAFTGSHRIEEGSIEFRTVSIIVNPNRTGMVRSYLEDVLDSQSS